MMNLRTQLELKLNKLEDQRKAEKSIYRQRSLDVKIRKTRRALGYNSIWNSKEQGTYVKSEQA
jgi:hypothetical protein